MRELDASPVWSVADEQSFELFAGTLEMFSSTWFSAKHKVRLRLNVNFASPDWHVGPFMLADYGSLSSI